MSDLIRLSSTQWEHVALVLYQLDLADKKLLAQRLAENYPSIANCSFIEDMLVRTEDEIIEGIT